MSVRRPIIRERTNFTSRIDKAIRWGRPVSPTEMIRRPPCCGMAAFGTGPEAPRRPGPGVRNAALSSSAGDTAQDDRRAPFDIRPCMGLRGKIVQIKARIAKDISRAALTLY